MTTERPKRNGHYMHGRSVSGPALGAISPLAPRSPSDSGEVLYSHPNAKVFSFPMPQIPGISSSRAAAWRFFEENPALIGTLPWQSHNDTIQGFGQLTIARASSNATFLSCGKYKRSIMVKTRCWCVDGSSKFAMIVSDFVLRVEMPYNDETDQRRVAEFVEVLKANLQYDNTPCPFKTGLTRQLPEQQVSPLRNKFIASGENSPSFFRSEAGRRAQPTEAITTESDMLGRSVSGTGASDPDGKALRPLRGPDQMSVMIAAERINGAESNGSATRRSVTTPSVFLKNQNAIYSEQHQDRAPNRQPALQDPLAPVTRDESNAREFDLSTDMEVQQAEVSSSEQKEDPEPFTNGFSSHTQQKEQVLVQQVPLFGSDGAKISLTDRASNSQTLASSRIDTEKLSPGRSSSGIETIQPQTNNLPLESKEQVERSASSQVQPSRISEPPSAEIEMPPLLQPSPISRQPAADIEISPTVLHHSPNVPIQTRQSQNTEEERFFDDISLPPRIRDFEQSQHSLIVRILFAVYIVLMTPPSELWLTLKQVAAKLLRKALQATIKAQGEDFQGPVVPNDRLPGQWDNSEDDDESLQDDYGVPLGNQTPQRLRRRRFGADS